MKSTFTVACICLKSVWQAVLLRAALATLLLAPLAAQHVEKILREEKPYSEDDCARAVGKPPLGHRKSFKDQAGCTPYEYYHQRRMIRARNLLVQSRLNLTEIALTLCFSDSAHFSNAFKTATGTSPLEYRKTYRDVARP